MQIMDLEPSFWRKIPFFALFGPEMEVHRSVEESRCTEMDKKFTRDTQSSNEIDKKYQKPSRCTLSLDFGGKYRFSSFLGPKWRSTGLLRCLDALKSIKSSQGTHNPLIKSIKRIHNPNYGPSGFILAESTDFGAYLVKFYAFLTISGHRKWVFTIKINFPNTTLGNCFDEYFQLDWKRFSSFHLVGSNFEILDLYLGHFWSFFGTNPYLRCIYVLEHH